MKILLIGDCHLADRPPSVRTDTYAQDILDKLIFCGKLAEKEGCELVVQAGDLFHIKRPDRNSHKLVQDTIDVFNKFPCPVRVVPGNHDMLHDRLDSIRGQPLGTVAKSPNVELLLGQDTDFPVFGLPYLQDYSDSKVRFSLFDWTDRFCVSADEGWMGKYPLMVTHASIFPNGDEPPYEFFSADAWGKLLEINLENKPSVYYGHIHDPHGTHYSKDGVQFCNQGAISRGSLHEATVARSPGVTVWDSEEGTFTRHEVPHKPAAEVFRLDEHQEVVQHQEKLTDFMASLAEPLKLGVSVDEVVAYAREQRTDEAVIKCIEECVEGVQ